MFASKYPLGEQSLAFLLDYRCCGTPVSVMSVTFLIERGGGLSCYNPPMVLNLPQLGPAGTDRARQTHFDVWY